MAEPEAGTRTRLRSSRDESAFEHGGGFAGLGHFCAKIDARLSFLGELAPEHGPLICLRPQAGCSNRLAYPTEETNRAFRDDDVRGRVILLQPKESVSGERRPRTDAA